MAETTAAALVKYWRALIAAGVPEGIANDMIRDAAGRLIQAKGLVVDE